MSNTLSNPSLEQGSHDVGMFYVDGMYGENPAAAARAEHLQHEYAERLAAPDPADAVQDAAIEVDNAYASGVYTGRDGNAIDPAHSEAVLREAAEVVDTHANHLEAVARVQVYGPMLENLRSGAEQSWGAEVSE